MGDPPPLRLLLAARHHTQQVTGTHRHISLGCALGSVTSIRTTAHKGDHVSFDGYATPESIDLTWRPSDEFSRVTGTLHQENSTSGLGGAILTLQLVLHDVGGRAGATVRVRLGGASLTALNPPPHLTWAAGGGVHAAVVSAAALAKVFWGHRIILLGSEIQ
jgi:hypothetical protein